MFLTLRLMSIVALLALPGWSQHLDRLDRELAQVMLQNVASDVRKNYYDPKLHGVDWDAKVGEAKEKIAKAPTWDDAILNIAAVLETLDDSHTVFYPTQQLMREEYGWRFQMIGEHCYVTQVRPKSDAETKGLKPGDEVLTISGFSLTRESLKKIKYVVNDLLPQSSLRVKLRDQSGKIRQVDVLATVRQHKQLMRPNEFVSGSLDAQEVRREGEDRQWLMRPRYAFVGDVMILKMPVSFVTELNLDGLFGMARKAGSLVLDLRSNPGGAESTLENLLSSVFDRDVKIADRVGREGTKSLTAKGNHHNAFTGKLIVLVDSESGSSAELFARILQIEKRGTVLGDHTAGTVMEAQYYGHVTGINPVYPFGTLVSVADLIMTDGKSLEHVGVTPDETIVPSAEDIAMGRDPVMARAAKMLGVSLSPEDAGKLFPYEWLKN
jgi:carboxyl-terminal processing protease